MPGLFRFWRLVGVPDRGEHRQAAKRTAADVEGHHAAAELGQPRRLSVTKTMWRLTPEKTGSQSPCRQTPKDENTAY
jgi:hypothetical protein